MKTIEYTEFEINDLIRTLEYAKNKKKEDYKIGKVNLSQMNYEIGIIADLMAKIPKKTYSNKEIDKDLIKNNKIIKIM